MPEPISRGKNTEAGTSAASAVEENPRGHDERLAAVEQERDEFRALLQRTQADFDNYQKRVRRDASEERPYVVAPLARELLPVLDNLDRALATAKQERAHESLTQGVNLVRAQLQDVLARFGVVPIDSLGRQFDPNFHEAVLQQPRTDVPSGTVIEVLESGFRLHDRVLRPAKVIVAAPPTHNAD